MRLLFLIFPIFLFSQNPSHTGVAIDTSNYRFVKTLIKIETTLIEHDTINPERYFNRGKLYREINEYKLALKDYNKCINLLPNDVASHYYRASTYEHLKDYEKAIKDFTKVVQLKPDWEWGYNDRGMMYLETGDYENAEKDFIKTLELKPNWTVALTNLGKVYNKKGKLNKAIEYFEKAIKSDSRNSLAFQNLGFAFFSQKKYDLAIENYTKAIELIPKYYNAIRSRADAKKAKGDLIGFCEDVKLAAKLGDLKAINYLKNNTDCTKK